MGDSHQKPFVWRQREAAAVSEAYGGEITSKAQSSKLIATDARMSGYSVPPSLAFFILWNNAIVIISPIRLAFACHCLFI